MTTKKNSNLKQVRYLILASIIVFGLFAIIGSGSSDDGDDVTLEPATYDASGDWDVDLSLNGDVSYSGISYSECYDFIVDEMMDGENYSESINISQSGNSFSLLTENEDSAWTGGTVSAATYTLNRSEAENTADGTLNMSINISFILSSEDAFSGTVTASAQLGSASCSAIYSLTGTKN